jgi:hypothetical protein
MKFVFALCVITWGLNVKVSSQVNVPHDIIPPLENMYIQFDKDIYLPGETIWFKAYLRNTTGISFLTTNLYIGFYNDKGILLQQKQYPIIQGAANGDFQIPDTIMNNAIQVVAFTKAMVLNDSKNFYQKVLNVFQKNNIVKNNTTLKNKGLQFYPEGGQMIADLENYIGFKASYDNGKPAMINGSIVEIDTRKSVDNFVTNKFGLGKIILVPEAGKQYMAVWKDDNGEVKQTILPFNNLQGITLHTEIANDKVEYSIVKNKDTDSLNAVHLLFQMGNYGLYREDIPLENEMQLVQGEFEIDKLPVGLLQVTLFNKYWKPLQQRLVFVNHNSNKAMPLVILDTVNKSGKGKNVITINLKDTFFTNLSVSVADINFYNDPVGISINKELYFNPQVNATYINIDSLLSQNDNSSIDLLLLTHAWKKYDWHNLDKEERNTPLDDYLGLSVQYKEKDLAIPQNDSLILIIKNKGTSKQFYKIGPVTPTTFKRTGLVFFDSVKVSYQMKKNKEIVDHLLVKRDEDIQMPATINSLQTTMNSYEGNTNPAGPLTAFRTPTKIGDTTTLREVVVKAKNKGNAIVNRIEELDKFYATGMFKGTVRGTSLNVIDDPMASSNPDIVSYIQFRVPGVKVMTDGLGEKYFYEYRQSMTKSERVIVPVFLDEIPCDHVSEIDVNKVAYVKYIHGIVINSFFRSDVGAVYIYSKTGKETEQVTNNTRTVNIKGYDQQQEFAGPDYSDKEQLKQPDFRSTVYWRPSVLLDKVNNKATIVFYNNDISKKLLVTIEGIDENGQLIHIEKIIE